MDGEAQRSRATAVRGPAIVDVLRQWLRRLPGKLLVIWDGAPIHRCQAVTDCRAAGAAARLPLERFPGSAPALTPDEGVWNLRKRVARKNRCCQDLDQLRWERGLAIRRVRRTPHRRAACFRQCGLVSTLMLRSVAFFLAYRLLLSLLYRPSGLVNVRVR